MNCVSVTSFVQRVLRESSIGCVHVCAAPSVSTEREYIRNESTDKDDVRARENDRQSKLSDENKRENKVGTDDGCSFQ